MKVAGAGSIIVGNEAFLQLYNEMAEIVAKIQSSDNPVGVRLRKQEEAESGE
jgi:hypothetical protein